MSSDAAGIGPPGTVPGAGRHFPRLDGLRGLAALGVFFYHATHYSHYPGLVGRLAANGNSGVALFFLLSGFLIYRPFILKAQSGRPMDVRGFYWRRAVRVLPAYWFALAVLAVYPGLVGSAPWWRLVTLTQIYDPTMTMAGIGTAWSLCIEVSFYAVLPAYAVLVRRWAPGIRAELALLAGLGVASVGAHLLIARVLAPNLSYTLPGTFYLFATGMAVAVLCTRTSVLAHLERRQDLLPVAAAALYVGLCLVLGPLGSVHLFYLPGATLVFLVGVLNSRSWTGRVLTSRVLVWFGSVSYAFYLWHQPVMLLFARWVHRPVWFTLTTFAVTLLVSAISWYLLERPLLRLAAAARRRPVPVAARPVEAAEPAVPTR